MIDYKKIIKARELRIKILSALSWIPDKLMLKIQYYIQTGKSLDLKNPQFFNEYVQAYKLYYRNPLLKKYVDKIEVRDYIKKKGLEHILVPLIGVYNTADEIEIEKLPEKYVIKTSDGGGGNQIYIKDEGVSDTPDEIKNIVSQWMSQPKPKRHAGREWAYENDYARRIMIEPLLDDELNSNDGVRDYKFLCFNGKFKCLWVDSDRFASHERGFWDEKLNYLEGVSCNYPTPSTPFVLPDNIQEMVEVAELLSKDFPFVRVDLYNVKGKIYFSELTFYPNSGYKVFSPISFDKQLGSYFAEAFPMSSKN